MSLHTKLILNTVHLYLENALKTEVYQRDKLLKIYEKIQGYNIFHKFTEAEQRFLVDMGTHSLMMKLKDVHVDFGVYGMELLTILIKDVPKSQRFMNISDKKIYEYKSNMVIDMIKLRGNDKHENIKAIIDDSRLTAKQFYSYTKDTISSH